MRKQKDINNLLQVGDEGLELKENNIAIIPARSGSKRITKKNIKLFNGRPIISYAISAAIECKLFDRVIVSTDSEEIALISKEYGAEAPFIRPKELADDYTGTVPVMKHAIETCEELGWKITLACCIYPCVPLIKIEDLKNVYSFLIENNGDYSYPVTEFNSPVQRALRQDNSGQMSMLDSSNQFTRSQNLEKAYYDVGQFYWGKKDAWINESDVLNGYGYVIPNWRVVDIDTPEDWIRAELISKSLFSE